MRFTLGKPLHYYYVTVLVTFTFLFAYGVKHYWDNGLLNIDYVSNLYDATNKVAAVKERNDIEEIKKYVDGDRIKEANKIFSRLEIDTKDLKSIKGADERSSFDTNMHAVKQSLIAFQSSAELTTILNSLNSKISGFESFVTEKNWPTLKKMSINLRMRLSPSRLMNGGLYNFERTKNLALSINNDLEAMANFTEASGLSSDLKSAIINRIKTLKNEASELTSYVDSHNKFSRIYREFSTAYEAWFKQVEPEIAYKKIKFEKDSQSIFYSLIAVFAGLIASLALGFMIYSFSVKNVKEKIENLVISTIKDGLLPTESKKLDKFSPSFYSEFDKYREYTHKRMAFGSIFQEAMPFGSILLDSNLNMIWGNSHFYDQWQLQNFKEEEDSLTWDFLQRFTNLENNSSILNALRMSTPGIYKIEVKSNTMAKPIPYEMHVSPVDYANQKRILIIFYPKSEAEQSLTDQRLAMAAPLLKMIELQFEEKMTTEMRGELRKMAESSGISDVFSKLVQYVEKNELMRDELIREIEELEAKTEQDKNLSMEMKKSLTAFSGTHRSSMEKYSQFRDSISAVIDFRDQLEEQFKYAMNSSREMYKEQNKVLTVAEKADKSVDEYIKSLKTISTLKNEFKDLSGNVDDFRSRIVQNLDQLLIFQGHEDDTQRFDQFLGKVKLEMKGFEKILQGFSQVITQLDVTVTKIDLMAESREKIDLDNVRFRMESIKNNLENVQFSASKIAQNSHSKDDEVVTVLKTLASNLKGEMRRVDEMCRLVGAGPEQLPPSQLQTQV